MGRRGPWSLVVPAGFGGVLFGWVAYYAEGWAGLRPFVNLEAMLLVGGGTLFCLTAAYPPGEVWRAVGRAAAGTPAGDDEEARRWADILRHGADSAVGMGGLATLLGMILMLSSIADVSAVPRRMALALSALFYGLLLSEAFFVPLARRVRGPDLTLRLPPPGGGPRRMLVALGAGGGAVLSFFVFLYAVSAVLNKVCL